MSQSKVDKKKYEKSTASEILRKQKIKLRLIAITVTIVVIAAIVGSVAGVKIYKAIAWVCWMLQAYQNMLIRLGRTAVMTLCFLLQLQMPRTQQTQLKIAEDTAEATDAEEDTTAGRE